MEHSDAEELLELAAAEPDGFARLAAGDTADAAALASHLAGCPACAAEFERLWRLATTLRDAVRTIPPADLRDRTLALVATAGRVRTPGPQATPAESAGALAVAGAGASGRTVAGAGPAIPSRAAGTAPRGWVLATAASLLIAVVGVAGWWSVRSDLEREQVATSKLAQVTEAAVRVGAQPDAEYVALAGAPTGGATARGEIVLSSASHELVVVADGLAEPAAGMEYRCWVEANGLRSAIGRMYLYGGIATWAGWSDTLDDLAPGAVFGVSLVEADAGGPGQVLLTGEL